MNKININVAFKEQYFQGVGCNDSRTIKMIGGDRSIVIARIRNSESYQVSYAFAW